VVGFAAVQPGYTLTNRLALRVRIARPFERGATWDGEAAIWWVW
jgi:hypothetical protein